MGRTAKTQVKAKVPTKKTSKANSKVSISKKTVDTKKAFDNFFKKPQLFSVNLSANTHNQMGVLNVDRDQLGQLAWEGRHQFRSQPFKIAFEQRYTVPPKVVVSISSLNTGSDTNSKIYTTVDSITNENFRLVVMTDDDSSIYNLGVAWFSSGN